MSTIVALLGLTAFCQLASAVGPIVSIPLGQLEGWEGKTRGGRIYEAWTKVPYAQPPVGKLRLNPPKRPTPWNGVLQATNATPACMQNTDGPPDLPVPNFSTEDCLYIDIYRPKDPKIKNLPVLVYIHGGAFAGGDVGGKHSADYLMDEDVILVQVNYRVNGFGFMSLGDDVLPGNYGQKDQAQALMWLNRNIQYFGGNRRRMTVFGESSGGASAHFLLKSPMTSKFLAGAVSHSGSINHVSTTLNTQFVRNNTLAVAAKVGCQGTDSRKIKKCLQTVDAEKLVDAISEVSDDPIQLFFAPVIEPRTVKGAFATEDLAIQSTQKPWIITFANGEYGLYVMMLRTKTDYVKNAAKNIDKYLENFLLIHTKNRDKIRKAVTVLKATYFKAKMTYSKFVEQLAKLHADNNFIYPAIFNANNHEGKTWLCQLEYSSSASRMSPNVHIAGHASHTDFYFNRGGRSGALRRAFPEMSKRLIKYLVNFAKYGNPTPKGSKINWPQFNSFEMLRIIGETDVVSTKPYFQTFQNLYDMWFSAIGWK